ncbi:MAG: hypothetical protein K9H49_04745 [Bacteroidales bacterium]|nr:hypothetical protein [Bacteroidales bacterium]MCF8389124.1 hypothetical protein [Bacteroidales bacterium]
MEKKYYQNWNRLVYYVSDVYAATSKFKTGKAKDLSQKIRKTAVSITVDLNRPQEIEKSKIYPLLSSVSVLETYLQLAKKYKFLKDTSVLDYKLKELKTILNQMLE